MDAFCIQVKWVHRTLKAISELTDEELAALDSVEILAEAARYNHETT